MSEKLSPRLREMLSLGLEGEDFWDICCDHGLLGEAALSSEKFRAVYFVDRVPHIVARLRERLGEDARIILSGGEELACEITGTVFIAGVGGHTIIKILGGWRKNQNLRVRRLVLNPLTHIGELRDFLETFEAYVETETRVVRESDRDRQIIVLESHGSRGL